MMHKQKILIADDDCGLTQALATRLRSSGYEVIVANDGYNALARAVQLQPDLLILDINMPAGNGFSVHERSRKVQPHCSIPVIYITGDYSDNALREAMEIGACSILTKPIEGRALLATVRAVLKPRAA